MERYHIYKLGIAILFYAVYCRRPMVNGLKVDDGVGTANNKSSTGEDYYVYYQGVQGKPGVDFPIHGRIPRTGFSCKEVESGYYADLDADCQVFHICNEGTKVSFLCPNGTIFQQSDLICDWWFKVNCTNSPNLYVESAEQLRESHIRRKASRRVYSNEDAGGKFHRQFSQRKMDVSEEMQVGAESAGFYGSGPNSIATTQKERNPYPNHRTTYSEVKYYTNLPTPASVAKSTINNGKPFVVSTPKLGVYTTERSTFRYSPTVPTIRPTVEALYSTYKQGKTTFGVRSTPRVRTGAVESFTDPPSVANGKSTAPRKQKNKNSFTIGLNSLQGAVAVKTQTSSTQSPNKGVIRLNLSSDGGAKALRNNGNKKESDDQRGNYKHTGSRNSGKFLGGDGDGNGNQQTSHKSDADIGGYSNAGQSNSGWFNPSGDGNGNQQTSHKSDADVGVYSNAGQSNSGRYNPKPSYNTQTSDRTGRYNTQTNDNTGGTNQGRYNTKTSNDAHVSFDNTEESYPVGSNNNAGFGSYDSIAGHYVSNNNAGSSQSSHNSAGQYTRKATTSTADSDAGHYVSNNNAGSSQSSYNSAGQYNRKATTSTFSRGGNANTGSSQSSHTNIHSNSFATSNTGRAQTKAGQYGVSSTTQSPSNAGQYGVSITTPSSSNAGQYGVSTTTQSPYNSGQYSVSTTRQSPSNAGQYGVSITAQSPSNAGQYGVSMTTQSPPHSGQYSVSTTTQSPSNAGQYTFGYNVGTPTTANPPTIAKHSGVSRYNNAGTLHTEGLQTPYDHSVNDQAVNLENSSVGPLKISTQSWVKAGKSLDFGKNSNTGSLDGAGQLKSDAGLGENANGFVSDAVLSLSAGLQPPVGINSNAGSLDGAGHLKIGAGQGDKTLDLGGNANGFVSDAVLSLTAGLQPPVGIHSNAGSLDSAGHLKIGAGQGDKTLNLGENANGFVSDAVLSLSAGLQPPVGYSNAETVTDNGFFNQHDYKSSRNGNAVTGDGFSSLGKTHVHSTRHNSGETHTGNSASPAVHVSGHNFGEERVEAHTVGYNNPGTSTSGDFSVLENSVRPPLRDTGRNNKAFFSLNNSVRPPLQISETATRRSPSYTRTGKSYNAQTNGFFVTKTNTFRPAEFITSDFNSGSITGSKNTYIPTTKAPEYTSTTTEYVSNTFGFLKPTGVPKPKPFEPASTTERPVLTTTEHDYEDYYDLQYQISSASPFTNVPPTLPTSYHTNSYELTSTSRPVNEHVDNMLDTLKEIADVRFNDSPRPGLLVPPSVGPQTLHTLAVYFANALDNLVPDEQPAQEEVTTVDEDLVINSLLSKKTVSRYNELFMREQEQEDEDAVVQDENDLNSEHSSNAVQSPRVRQLAKVFTQALSSYLDDPDMFRKVLQQVRPTEPPPLRTLPTDNPEEDELLNFSDADIKPEAPRLPTPPPANPTWGYILAFNNSNSNHLDNSENLQTADSQSFVSSYNDIRAGRTHWTQSPEVTKLWRNTLLVDPLILNENLEKTEQDSVEYELRALPTLHLNSTQVHGLLINFMNSTDDSAKLKRILEKLNTTQDEFLEKMKQIEENPLTRRLILLLVSECASNATLDKADTVRDILNLANSSSGESLQPASTDWEAAALRSNLTLDRKPSAFTKLVDPNLKEDDQDARALQLLNSLYSIASKYGK